MMISELQVSTILSRSGPAAKLFTPLLNKAMRRYEINNKHRIAAFIAQIGYESGELRYLRELDRGFSVNEYDQEAFAMHFGTPFDADGGPPLYHGRGLLKITGLTNYRHCGAALDVDLVNHPQWLEHPEYACLSAAWYWHSEGLNCLADKGAFVAITRQIKGSLNGQTGRLILYHLALSVLG
jgi:putative chitinase